MILDRIAMQSAVLRPAGLEQLFITDVDMRLDQAFYCRGESSKLLLKRRKFGKKWINGFQAIEPAPKAMEPGQQLQPGSAIAPIGDWHEVRVLHEVEDVNDIVIGAVTNIALVEWVKSHALPTKQSRAVVSVRHVNVGSGLSFDQSPELLIALRLCITQAIFFAQHPDEHLVEPDEEAGCGSLLGSVETGELSKALDMRRNPLVSSLVRSVISIPELWAGRSTEEMGLIRMPLHPTCSEAVVASAFEI